MAQFGVITATNRHTVRVDLEGKGEAEGSPLRVGANRPVRRSSASWISGRKESVTRAPLAQEMDRDYGSSDDESGQKDGFKRGLDGFPLWDSGLCFPHGIEKKLSLRQQVYLTFDDPSASLLARVVSVVVFFFIVLSTTAFIVATLPELRDTHSATWLSIEVVSIVVFTVEYIVRLICAPHLIKFMFDFMNLIDLAAIVPFYIEIFVNLILGADVEFGLQFLRIMRVARVFRVMKISKYSTAMQLFGRAMKEAVGGLYLLLVYLGIAVIIFSSVMYYAERGTWDENKNMWIRDDGTESPYSSIPASFYWSVVTMTTVGYGDQFPITAAGKCVAMLCMLMGILIIALPTSIIGSKFQQVMEEHRAGAASEDNFRSVMHTTAEWENQKRELEQYLITSEHLLKKIRQKTYILDRMYVEQSTEKLKIEKMCEDLKLNLAMHQTATGEVVARSDLVRRVSQGSMIERQED